MNTDRHILCVVDRLFSRNVTITNPLAYTLLALDFDIWARAPSKEVQKAHLSHFSALLETSKFRRFNVKQRLSKYNLIRKLLFVLQTDIYSNDMIPQLVQIISIYMKHHFVADITIKPIVAYLAANLHEGVIYTIRLL